MSEVNNLPVLQSVAEVEIPTKKLTITQQKLYREYADRVIKNIKGMLRDVAGAVIQKYEDDNRQGIVDKLAKEKGIDKVMEEFAKLKKEIEDANTKSRDLVAEYGKRIVKLEMERDSAIMKYKTETLLPLMEKLDKHIASVTAREELNNPYGRTAGIYNAREYVKKGQEDDIDDGFDTGNRRQIEFVFPAVNIKQVAEWELRHDNYINSHDIDVELQEIMKPVKAEFKAAEVKLGAMEETVTEVMMFDEARMNKAFQKLFQFRDSIRDKHLEIVQGVSTDILNVTNNGEEDD